MKKYTAKEYRDNFEKVVQEVESGEKVMVVDGEVEAILEMGDIEFVKMHTTEGFDL
tara:strand:+ start:146 stop:313 length:168 start_codon:yes stop_codon:yes gene_type:complete